jgi:hypothetical protein
MDLDILLTPPTRKLSINRLDCLTVTIRIVSVMESNVNKATFVI